MIFKRERSIENFIPLLIVTMLLSGCAAVENRDKYSGRIVAITNAEILPNSTFWISNKDSSGDKEKNDVWNCEGGLRNALIKKGFTPSNSKASSSWSIVVSHNISSPMLIHQTSRDSNRVLTGQIIPTVSNGIVSYQPEYAWTSAEKLLNVDSYIASLQIIAYQNADDVPFQKEAWKTIVSATVFENNLRNVLPYLLKAVEPYLANSTDAQGAYFQIATEDSKVSTSLSGCNGIKNN